MAFTHNASLLARRRWQCLLFTLLFIGAAQLAAGHTHEDEDESEVHADHCQACQVLHTEALAAHVPLAEWCPVRPPLLRQALPRAPGISYHFCLARAPPSL